MRYELDEHREVINENTNEIQTNFDFLCELDKKIDALHDRIDEFTLILSGRTGKKAYDVKPLSAREKTVFWAVLSLTESFSAVTPKQIATHLGISPAVVGSYISRMQEKGVPFMKKIRSGKMAITLEKGFRQAQIKQNVVGLEVPLTHWF
jgi:DNA-binding CsgD family transcriptional regulator